MLTLQTMKLLVDVYISPGFWQNSQNILKSISAHMVELLNINNSFQTVIQIVIKGTKIII